MEGGLVDVGGFVGEEESLGVRFPRGEGFAVDHRAFVLDGAVGAIGFFHFAGASDDFGGDFGIGGGASGGGRVGGFTGDEF